MKDLLKRMQKKTPDCYFLLGNNSNLVPQTLSTGIPSLDGITAGGLHRGRLNLMIGNYGSGKTLLAQKIIANTQANGGVAAYVDAEIAYDPKWFATFGVKTDELMVGQPISGEAAFDGILQLIDEDEVELIVLDSVAAAEPTEEEEKSMGESTVGAQARMLGKGLRKIYSKFQRRRGAGMKNPALLFINQTRMGIGGTTGEIALPGGKSQSFFASLKIVVSRHGWHTEDKKRTGFDIKCFIDKNKLGTPFTDCLIPFELSGQLDTTIGLIDVGLTKGIITQSGTFYKYKDVQVQGKLGLIERIKQDEDLFKKLLKDVG